MRFATKMKKLFSLSLSMNKELVKILQRTCEDLTKNVRRASKKLAQYLTKNCEDLTKVVSSRRNSSRLQQLRRDEGNSDLPKGGGSCDLFCCRNLHHEDVCEALSI
jgi:hypothetical protein